MSTEEQAQPQTVFLETLDQFVRALHYWHQNKTQLLAHMHDIPDGSEVENNGETLVLTGDILKGFKLGIELALSELGALPFEVELEFNKDAPIITDSAASTH